MAVSLSTMLGGCGPRVPPASYATDSIWTFKNLLCLVASENVLMKYMILFVNVHNFLLKHVIFFMEICYLLTVVYYFRHQLNNGTVVAMAISGSKRI